MMPEAARVGDMHSCPMPSHIGGLILPNGSPDIEIEFMAAARARDIAACVGCSDSILEGSPSVFLNGKLAARVGDETVHGGVITCGAATVEIGILGDGISSDSDGGINGSVAEAEEHAGQDGQNGGSGDSDGRDEADQKLTALVLMIGGAGDDSFGHNVEVPAASYQATHAFGAAAEVKYYTWTDKSAALADIEEFIKKPGQHRIAIIGHSYGGDTAYLVARDTSARVACLVTVDAASWLTFNIHRPSSVEQWINVFVHGHHYTDGIATVGGHWGYREGAENHDLTSEGLTHADFLGMFNRFVGTVKSTLGT